MGSSEILSQLRMHLPEDIGVLSCEEVPLRFHARLNAISKTYEYRVWNSAAPCVFQRKYVYRFPVPLNLEAMKQAADFLVGRHDFRSFCSNKKFKKSTIRTIYSLNLVQMDRNCALSSGATASCIIWSGFWWVLLEVGMGQKSPMDLPDILSAQNREAAGYTVPACGLF